MKTLFVLLFTSLTLVCQAQTPVEQHGKLHIEGVHILDEHNEIVQLRGMSFFWSQWMDQYYTKATVKWLVRDWKCDVIRIAMGVNKGGYLQNPEEELAKVNTIVKAAVSKGIYVVIDYHAHDASKNQEAALKFFAKMAKKYGELPNVIYETYNEPIEDSWSEVLKPYHKAIIDTIRHYDPDNIIVCGTRNWSQRVDEAANDPITNEINIAYTLHFYAHTHRDELRAIAQQAIDKGICLFVTEFGTVGASGNGYLNYEETKAWMELMDKYKISWCNWSVSDKQETASIIKPGTSPNGYWHNSELTPSGIYIRQILRTGNFNKPVTEIE